MALVFRHLAHWLDVVLLQLYWYTPELCIFWTSIMKFLQLCIFMTSIMKIPAIVHLLEAWNSPNHAIPAFVHLFEAYSG
ncbi:hypothetical protein BC351_03315 [Paenibacillus ferrarius]|uniref:Uncharacterized protein n=1 Tax=Paenibacillus ferrarius TaxID=1469647 RepID=A0A1V4HL16_9BACL|nr:hypothetical protein BC351_03315 [Paenibacillus ferrarius]